MSDDTDSDFSRMVQLITDHAVAEQIALFHKTGNGLYLWTAYREARKPRDVADVRVPEALLRELDKVMSGLLRAETSAEALAAMKLRQEKGGSWKRKHREKVDRQHQVVKYIAVKQQAFPGLRPGVLYAEAAERYGMTVPAVKTLYSRWKKSADKRSPAIDKLVRAAWH